MQYSNVMNRMELVDRDKVSQSSSSASTNDNDKVSIVTTMKESL